MMITRLRRCECSIDFQLFSNHNHSKIWLLIFLNTIVIAVIPRGSAATETTRCCQSELQFRSVNIWLSEFRMYATVANLELLYSDIQTFPREVMDN